MSARNAARRLALRGVRFGRQLYPRRSGTQRLRPPKAPPGWRVAPPDFVGLGAPGAATGWWHAQIERHPDVYRLPATVRELHWFDRFWLDPFTAADATRYAAWFPRPEGGMAGEWTPSYFTDFWVPELLARAAPQARVIVLLRDPVTRYAAARYAAARYAAARPGTVGRTGAPWDDRDALGTFQRGLYAEPVRRLLRAYPPGQVLLLQEEACRQDPEAALTRTLSFIGLRPARLADAPPTPSAKPAQPLPDGTQAALAKAYAADMAQLSKLVPEVDLALWTRADATPRHEEQGKPSRLGR